MTNEEDEGKEWTDADAGEWSGVTGSVFVSARGGVFHSSRAGNGWDETPRVSPPKCSRWESFFVFLRVVHLVVVLCGGAGGVSADGGGAAAGAAAAAVLVVVGERQAQQAGAGGQVDVLHVLHVRPAHGTQLRGKNTREAGD